MNKGLTALVLALNLFLAAPSIAQTPSMPATPTAKGTPESTERVQQKFTGDLDEMIQRRFIRILVTYSKTHYFVDTGTQRGLTYEFGRLFEDSLNKKLNNKHVRVNVFFFPVARDELIPALIEGRGDLAAANLTITSPGPGLSRLRARRTFRAKRYTSSSPRVTTRASRNSMPNCPGRARHR